jgi:hypothetical protein
MCLCFLFFFFFLWVSLAVLDSNACSAFLLVGAQIHVKQDPVSLALITRLSLFLNRFVFRLLWNEAPASEGLP